MSQYEAKKGLLWRETALVFKIVLLLRRVVYRSNTGLLEVVLKLFVVGSNVRIGVTIATSQCWQYYLMDR